jgi:hypothetical protein
MPGKARTGAVKWTESLDEHQVNEAFEDAVVDAYGEHEQHSGLLTMVENDVKFPFAAMVLGELVTVVSMEWPEGDEFGLDFVCERNGERHRVDARSVDLVSPFPDGHLYIAAYLDWKRSL